MALFNSECTDTFFHSLKLVKLSTLECKLWSENSVKIVFSVCANFNYKFLFIKVTVIQETKNFMNWRRQRRKLILLSPYSLVLPFKRQTTYIINLVDLLPNDLQEYVKLSSKHPFCYMPNVTYWASLINRPFF